MDAIERRSILGRKLLSPIAFFDRLSVGLMHWAYLSLSNSLPCGHQIE
jgi:hypothetical protein